MLKDTIYYNIGFGGYPDESIQKVIDNGVIIKHSNGGNWDYFFYDNGYFAGVYYVARVPGCRSGYFSGLPYWEKHKRDELQKAVDRYRKMNRVPAPELWTISRARIMNRRYNENLKKGVIS